MILVFDLQDPGSFDRIRNWLDTINAHAEDNVCKVLLGNKLDLTKNVSQEEINELLKEVKIPYFETSAKDNVNIDEAFNLIATNILENFHKFKGELLDSQQSSYIKNIRNDKKPNNKSCC